METEQLVRRIVTSLDTHKAEDIRVLKTKDISSLADYFVLATGGSSTQVRSLSDYVETELQRDGVEPLHREGLQTVVWTLLDYGPVIVHIFQRQAREFYDLERLWQDAEQPPLELFLEGNDL